MPKNCAGEGMRLKKEKKNKGRGLPREKRAPRQKE